MRATWFEIPVNDMARARQFYSNILEIKMGDEMQMGTASMCFFPWEDDEEGSTGSLIKQESYTPSYQGAMIYLSVKEIDPVIERIKAEGTNVINEKMSIGQFGFVAHFEDSEGNRVALHQAP